VVKLVMVRLSVPVLLQDMVRPSVPLSGISGLDLAATGTPVRTRVVRTSVPRLLFFSGNAPGFSVRGITRHPISGSPSSAHVPDKVPRLIANAVPSHAH
jgi:hypothetical protein